MGGWACVPRQLDMTMTKTRLFTLAAALVAMGALTGCASSFKADVTRFHEALPPPAQGQSFTVVPDDSDNAGSLEFGHYADLVAEHLAALGYPRAEDPANAQLIVRLDYGVDKGTQHVRSTGLGYRSPFYDPFYRSPAIYRTRRGVYVMGYSDPFLWGPSYPEVESYTVFQSQLKLRIDKADGSRIFEGTARARSLSNKLTYLVPNLIDAVFQGFPGKNGEEVRVTIAPEPTKK